jgi:hypothetical protein
MTAPLHARDIPGKGRYYGGCSETCPLGQDIPTDLEGPALLDWLYLSVTNAQDVINKPALPPSAAKITATAAWDRLPQMVATSRQDDAGIPADGGKPCEKRSPVSTRCGRCRFCVTAAIKAEYRQQWESKADLGTEIHHHAHALVLGQPMPYDEVVQPFVDQHIAFLDAWRIDLDRHVEAAETTVFDRKNRYAGTGDLWLHLPLTFDAVTGITSFTSWTRRKLWLIDLKTSLEKPANVVYADQPLQLAGLRFAPTAVLVDDTEITVPKFEGAAILNLRTNTHALIPQPADRDVHKAFLGAVTLQRLFHSQDVKAWQPVETPVVPEPEAVAS